MIYGVGIDLLDFSQVNLENKKFIQKILTAKECLLFAEKTTDEQRIAFFAGRFAAKEAYVKALGTGFRNIEFQNIEILNNELGQPTLAILKTEDKVNQDLICHVSLSHSTSAATAIVVLERRGDEGNKNVSNIRKSSSLD